MPSRPSVSEKREEVSCAPLSVFNVKFSSRPQAAVRARPAPPMRARLRSDTDARHSIPRSPCTAIDHAHQVRPAHCRTRPDLRHVRLPDLIRLGCFHAAPLFLPSCAQTTRTHQPPAFLASPVTPAPDSRSTLSSAAATTPRADSRMPASHAITICSSAETPRKARPGLGRITVNTVLSVNECSLTCMSIDEDAPMAVDVLAMGISQSLEGHKGNVRQGAV